jgi:hypothetical protein
MRELGIREFRNLSKVKTMQGLCSQSLEVQPWAAEKLRSSLSKQNRSLTPIEARHRWLIPVILSSWETEI